MSLPQTNADQRDFWNGPIAETWVREQPRLDRAFTPFTAALIARIGMAPGASAVEIGCGCGEVSLALAKLGGTTGRVLGLDLSRPMLAKAAENEGRLRDSGMALAPLDWQEADASRARFGPDFDHLVSRFGTMFFDDPVAAFRNLRGGLKPAGRLTMLCWQSVHLNAWTAVPVAAIATLYGPEPPTAPGSPGPFAFADPDRTTAILREAGFAEISAHPVVATTLIGVAGPDVSALDDGLVYATEIGPVARYLRDHPERREPVRAAVREALSDYVTGDTVALPAACWIYSAERE